MQATLDKVVELYLISAYSLEHVAEVANATRRNILDAFQLRGGLQRPNDAHSADEMDDLADRLEQQGIL